MGKTKQLKEKAAKVIAKVSMPMSPLWHMGQVGTSAKLNALGAKVGISPGTLVTGDDNLKVLQDAIDYLTAKAKTKGKFDEDEKEFLVEIYEALWWGGKFKSYPEAAALANAYVNGDGADLKIDAAVYSSSAIVQAVQLVMKRQIAASLKTSKGAGALSLRSTDSRLLKRGDYLALFRGKGRKADGDGYLIDDGVLLAEQENKRLKNADNRVVLQSVSQHAPKDAISTTWRVDSYYDFEPFHRAAHVTHIPLAPGATLLLPDGLSHYMVEAGVATEFKYYAAWPETWNPADLPAPAPAKPGGAKKKK